MKKFFKLGVLAITLVVCMAVVAFAESVITYDLVEVDENAYDVVVNVKCVEGEEVRMLVSFITFNNELFIPVDCSDYVTAVELVDGEYVDDDTPIFPAETKVGKKTYSYAVSDARWTTAGNKTTVKAGVYTTDFDKFDCSDIDVATISFKLAEGKSVDDIKAGDFTVDRIQFVAGEGLEYGYNEPAYTLTTTPVNNVAPEASEEPTKLTIAVATGDVVYLQDGTVVTIAEANEAYEIPTTAGTVVVNTVNADGVQTAQKVYTVADGAVTADTTKADGVLATNEASIRGDNVYNGIRYKSTFLTALKDVVDEYGYITTVESAYNALPDDYVLNMALVDAGKAVKDVAYDDETDIFWNVDGDKTVVTAVVTNVPMTNEGVTTNIVIRPYYKVGSLVVYGEPMTRTVYEVALNIKENDAETYAKYQEYIDEILALCEETDVVIDFGPLFK